MSWSSSHRIKTYTSLKCHCPTGTGRSLIQKTQYYYFYRYDLALSLSSDWLIRLWSSRIESHGLPTVPWPMERHKQFSSLPHFSRSPWWRHYRFLSLLTIHIAPQTTQKLRVYRCDIVGILGMTRIPSHCASMQCRWRLFLLLISIWTSRIASSSSSSLVASTSKRLTTVAKRDGLKNSLASALAAGCSKTLLAPFDTIKTMQQNSLVGNAISLPSACRLILARPRGILEFYVSRLISGETKYNWEWF